MAYLRNFFTRMVTVSSSQCFLNSTVTTAPERCFSFSAKHQRLDECASTPKCWSNPISIQAQVFSEQATSRFNFPSMPAVPQRLNQKEGLLWRPFNHLLQCCRFFYTSLEHSQLSPANFQDYCVKYMPGAKRVILQNATQSERHLIF